MKVFLSPSQQEHNAYAGKLGVESTHARRVCKTAASVLEEAGIAVKVAADYTRLNEPNDYYSAIGESNRWMPDIHVAVHTNAGGGRGTYTYWTSSAGKTLATFIQKAIAPVSPGKERDSGLRHTDGFAELNLTVATAVLTELEFHDWLQGAKFINAHPTLLGEALANGILKYGGIKPQKFTAQQVQIRKLFLSLNANEQEWVLKYAPRWHEQGG